MKLLDIGADDAERWERKKKHKNPDTGFAGMLLLNFFYLAYLLDGNFLI